MLNWRSPRSSMATHARLMLISGAFGAFAGMVVTGCGAESVRSLNSQDELARQTRTQASVLIREATASGVDSLTRGTLLPPS